MESGSSGRFRSAVFDESAAEAAGLEAGDILLTADGHPLRTAADASAYLRGGPGSKDTVTYLREGETRTTIIVGTR